MRLTTKSFIFVGVLFSVFLVQSSAYADRRGYGDTPPGVVASGGVDFQALDDNEDGIISQEEWLNNARAGYQALDLSRDGNVSYNEFHGIANKWKRKRQPRFEEIDANHDGVLSKDEWPANASEYYAALDANGDGNVSYNEFFNHKQISATVLKGLDTNNDNRISRGEWTGEAAEFNRTDANKDNFLTVAELTAASAAPASTSASAENSSSSIEDIFLKLLQK